MSKEIEIIVASQDFLEALVAFNFDSLRYCPDEGLIDFRAKRQYTEDEKRILKLIPNVTSAKPLYCPTVCSGLRGDGSRFRERCNHFIGYGENDDEVFNFFNPQSFVRCSKYGKIRIEKYTTDCLKRKLAVTVARDGELINFFNSATLEYVPKTQCLKCNSFDRKTETCSFKVGCEKGKGLWSLHTDCTCGDCDSCQKVRVG